MDRTGAMKSWWRTRLRLAVRNRRILLAAAHLSFVTLAYAASFALADRLRISSESWSTFLRTLPFLLVLRLLFFERFGLFRGYWRHVGIRDLLQLAIAVSVGSVGFLCVMFAIGNLLLLPPAVPALDWLLTITFIGGVRLAVRSAQERLYFRPTGTGTRAFILGAGTAGEQLLRELQHDAKRDIQVVGLLDDDPEKRDRALHGVPVLGTIDELRGFAMLHRVTHALIAIPSASAPQLRRLVDRCQEAGLQFKALPPRNDSATGDVDVGVSQLREVRIEDLLGREPITLELGSVASDVAGQTVLITGAGGSIGSELVRQVL